MGLTAVPWQLSYPDSSDRPSDAADSLFQLADRMDYHLSNWQADDARLRRRPAAKVTYDSTVRYKLNSQALYVAYYNNVQQDTAGMVDLQKRADRIYFPRSPRPALYAVGGTIVGLGDVTDLSTSRIRLVSNSRWSFSGGVAYPFTTRDSSKNGTDTTRGETWQISTTILAYQSTDTGAYDDDQWVQLEINPELGVSVNFTVWYADLWAFWLTDCGTIPPV